MPHVGKVHGIFLASGSPVSFVKLERSICDKPSSPELSYSSTKNWLVVLLLSCSILFSGSKDLPIFVKMTSYKTNQMILRLAVFVRLSGLFRCLGPDSESLGCHARGAAAQ